MGMASISLGLTVTGPFGLLLRQIGKKCAAKDMEDLHSYFAAHISAGNPPTG
jgi:hypothetical protein